MTYKAKLHQQISCYVLQTIHDQDLVLLSSAVFSTRFWPVLSENGVRSDCLSATRQCVREQITWKSLLFLIKWMKNAVPSAQCFFISRPHWPIFHIQHFKSLIYYLAVMGRLTSSWKGKFSLVSVGVRLLIVPAVIYVSRVRAWALRREEGLLSCGLNMCEGLMAT